MDKPHSQTDFGVETGTSLEPFAVFYTKRSLDGLRLPTLWGQPGTGGGWGREVGGRGRGVVTWWVGKGGRGEGLVACWS